MSATKIAIGENVGVLGRAYKENADIVRVLLDFSRWLDTGEVIGSLSGFLLAVSQVTSETEWQPDYPLPPPTSGADTYPLVLAGATVVGGNKASILLSAGTPGLTYVVSLRAQAQSSGRVKEVNFVVIVIAAVNPGMISSQSQVTSAIVVTGTTTLPIGTAGTVYVENGAAAPITITLPQTPYFDQTIPAVDAGAPGSRASNYTISWQGYGGALINDLATYDFTQDFQAASFRWAGTNWVVL